MSSNFRFSFVRVSGNRKTGPIPTTMTSANSCPPACPLSKNGCYAGVGLVAMQWRKLDNSGLSFAELLDNIKNLPKGTFFRHNVAGDLPGDNDRIDVDALAQIVKAAKGKKGFTYTHYPVTDNPHDDNRAAIIHANDNGFAVNLSANSPAHADRLASLDIGPVVTMLPEDTEKVTYTPQGRKIVVCPAVSSEKVTCASCQVCADSDRGYIIGFPVHGAQKKKAQKVIEVTNVP